MIMMKPPMYPMPNMGGMGGMGGMMSPMMPMMKMMQMMMRMMQGMMGGGCSPCGMPGMGGMGMPGMGGMGMPGMGGMGMPGMGGMGMPGMGGNGMGFMMGGTMNGMNGQMSFMLGGFLGAGQQNPGMMGPNAMAGIGQQSPMGKGGLRVEGDKVITPGGYSITFKGTDVTIEGMGKDAKKQQTQGQQGGFMAAGAFASSGPFGASAGAFMIGGFGGNQGPQQPEATGKTRVHGDPHVDEGDGGHWDWKDKTMSYNLPDGTKVTMEAKSAKGVVEKVDVYNGNDHVSGTKGKWDGGVTQDRMQADAAQADGDSVYAKGGDVSSWYHNPMGMGPEIAQQYGKK